jgi:glycosyltransferase involved in cell wall biosynthesis
MEPIVSVIISLYRGERYLANFFSNIHEQTWFDRIEFIIDHNDPTELEINLIKKFQEEHPGRLKHLVRDGVVPYSASWNRCIENASSEIIAIWNVDDTRTPASIELQAQPILSGQADLVFGNYIRVRSQGETTGERVRITETDPYFYSRRFVFGPFFMFKKALCQKAGYLDEQLRSSADVDFAIRLTMYANIFPLDVDLGYYLDERMGLSTRPNSRRKVESTVVGLRYGNYDALNYTHIPEALRFDVYSIKYGETKHHVSEYVPDYANFFKKRRSSSIFIGPYRFMIRELGQLKRLIRSR